MASERKANLLRFGAALAIGIAVLTCSGAGTVTDPDPDAPTRSWRMGFSAIPPRVDTAAVLQVLGMWTPRADAAIMHVDVPWAALLSGISASDEVRGNELNLANYYRARDLQLFVTIDVTNGLDRAAESPALVQLGRSITEPEVQQAYRDYVKAMASILRPAYIGLAAETNLIRVAAPRALYEALVAMVNAAANDLTAMASASAPYVSVQVETAWGATGQGTAFVGVEQDFRDFPFMKALGLSSYPYFPWSRPEDLPPDYYSRVRGNRDIPVMVVEGGWTSGSVGNVNSSPELQARYLRRQAALLDSAHAVALFQLTFTDLDVSSFNVPPGSILPLFAQLGMVDVQLRPKPALAVWDSLFHVRRSERRSPRLSGR